MRTLRSRGRPTLFGLVAATVVATGCATTAPPATESQARTPAEPEITITPVATVVPVASEPKEPESPVPPEASMIGTNLACAEFGRLGGGFGKAYTYPGKRSFEYCARKGMKIARLPFKWERLQPTPMSPFDPAEQKRLDATVALAREHGMKLLLDVHNYARRKVGDKSYIIGTPEVPNAMFADLWKRLAERYKDDEGVFAYGLVNEPHDTKGLWPAAAQAAIDAIRTVDTGTCIFVCGDSWGGAHSWLRANKDLILKDPSNNLVYEAHQYFDWNSSGTYKGGYEENNAYPDIGVDRLKPFATWLKQNDLRGFIGEFGVPDNDPRWLVVLDRFCAAMKKENIGGAYWASGPWWGGYALALEPRDGKDRPQMAVLERYFGEGIAPSDEPWVEAAAEMEATRGEREKARRARVAAQAAKDGPRVIHDFAARKEAYHYTNKGSHYESAAAVDNGARCRKVSYRHVGNPAWVGVGTFFGGLKTGGYRKFVLQIRSDAKTRLEVKAYRTDKDKYAAHFDVGTGWQELGIPFDGLKGKEGTFATAGSLHKLELQPAGARGGNAIYLQKLSVAP